MFWLLFLEKTRCAEFITREILPSNLEKLFPTAIMVFAALVKKRIVSENRCKSGCQEGGELWRDDLGIWDYQVISCQWT